MGMFDYVKCEVPLPDGWEGSGLQTKALDCGLRTYVIGRDGRLYLVDKQTGARFDQDHHGIIDFYSSEIIPGPSGKHPTSILHKSGKCFDYETGEEVTEVWHEYEAKFTDGQLVEIKTVRDAE